MVIIYIPTKTMELNHMSILCGQFWGVNPQRWKQHGDVTNRLFSENIPSDLVEPGVCGKPTAVNLRSVSSPLIFW